MGMALDLGAQRSPVEIEILYGQRALRIPHPDQGDIACAVRERKGESLRGEFRPAHIHLELEAAILVPQQAQQLEAGARAHAYFVRLMAVLDQKGGGAARAVARNLRLAAVGIEQPYG